MSGGEGYAGVNVRMLNEAIRGFTEVLHFDLTRGEGEGRFDLRLTLANNADSRLTLRCSDVQNLELNPAGNGFEPMLRLQVEDMREDGLDRIRYSVEELERETLFLHCADVALEPA